MANGITTIAGIMPSVSRIKETLADGKLGRDRRFDLRLDRESGAYKMDYTDKKGGEEEKAVPSKVDNFLQCRKHP